VASCPGVAVELESSTKRCNGIRTLRGVSISATSWHAKIVTTVNPGSLNAPKARKQTETAVSIRGMFN
jgi:hypothetical protein